MRLKSANKKKIFAKVIHIVQLKCVIHISNIRILSVYFYKDGSILLLNVMLNSDIMDLKDSIVSRTIRREIAALNAICV